MEHAARLHAPFSASGMARRFACPGSHNLCKTVPPRPSSSFAEEGTRAHELLELILANRAPVPLDVDPDMLAHVMVAVDHVNALLDAYPDAILLVEQRFEIPSEHAPGEVSGTCDILIYVPSTATLYVIDFKYGAGIPVEVDGNKQLLFYAVGALYSLPDVRPASVMLTVIQPRCFHPKGPVRTQELTVVDLMDYHADLEAAIAACLAPGAPLVPGPSQCKFCDAAPTCPAIEATALAQAQLDFNSVRLLTEDRLPDPRQMSADRLGFVLQARELFDVWFKEVEKAAEELLRAGGTVPGRKLVNAQARRRYAEKLDIDTAMALIDLSSGELTLDEVMPRKLITITDAEIKLKAVARGGAPRGKKTKAAELAAEAMAFLTIKESSGALVMVSEKDRRPAVSAQSQFGTVELPVVTLDEKES